MFAPGNVSSKVPLRTNAAQATWALAVCLPGLWGTRGDGHLRWMMLNVYAGWLRVPSICIPLSFHRTREFLPSPNASTNMHTARAHADGSRSSRVLLSEFSSQKRGCLLQFRDVAEGMQVLSSCTPNLTYRVVTYRRRTCWTQVCWTGSGDPAPDLAQRAAREGADDWGGRQRQTGDRGSLDIDTRDL